MRVKDEHLSVSGVTFSVHLQCAAVVALLTLLGVESRGQRLSW